MELMETSAIGSSPLLCTHQRGQSCKDDDLGRYTRSIFIVSRDLLRIRLGLVCRGIVNESVGILHIEDFHT